MGLVLSSTLALSEVEGGETTFPPRLGVNTLYRNSGASVTASAEATDGDKENAYKEGFTHDFWRPGSSGDHWLQVSLNASSKADYLAIAAHDLHKTNGAIKAQYSDDGGATWNDAFDAVTPPNSQPIMVLFDEQQAADWRLHVSSTSGVSIGAVHIGAVTKLRVGIQPPWTPPYLDRDNRYVNERSEGGQFVGRSLIAQGARLNLDLEHIPMNWIRQTWEPALRKMEQYPFFFAARDLSDASNREREVFYGWLDGQPSARYENPMWGSISMRARGLID